MFFGGAKMQKMYIKRCLPALVLMLAALCLFTLSTFSTAHAAELSDLQRQRIEQTFPQVNMISEPEGKDQVRTLTNGVSTLYGYAIETFNMVNIPAYSDKSISIQVLLDAKGVIADSYVLEHHEPILLIGIPEQKLHDFSAKYVGIK